MSDPRATAPHEPAAASHDHASVATYVKVAVILSMITALEFGVIYIRQLTPVLIPLLVVMSAAKFAMVVMFFMHLKYDSRALSAVFLGPLVLATLLAIALATTTGAFLVYGR